VPDLATSVGGLKMRNPLMLASGTVGYGSEYADLLDFEAVGAVVMKTVSLEPMPGNRPPRLVEAPSGLVNSIGLENVGVESFLRDKLPGAAFLPAPLVASITGPGPRAFAELVARVGEHAEVSAVELNVSCPNVERRRPVWDDPDAVAEIVGHARAASERPLFLKLSPNTARAVDVARAAELAGVDALVVANTMPAMRVDLERRTPALGNTYGGLSGPALLPINLALVWKVAGAVSVPVIGCGGITTAEDVLEYLMAGATAVQLGTALYGDPEAPANVVRGLLRHMEKDGAKSIDHYVGLAREETVRCEGATVAG
jgi:dihydroorotate dehydrogenase (NAD+) catalytic subunit